MSSAEMNDAVEAMKKVKKTITDLQAKRGGLLTQEKHLADRKGVLLTQPLSPADIKAFLFDLIDARASEYPTLANLERLFGSIIYPERGKGTTTEKLPALCLRDIDSVANGGHAAEISLFGYRGIRLFGSGSDLTSHTDFAAYFFFGDIIKKKIGEQLDEHLPAYRPGDEVNIGPSVADRRKELEQIEAELTKVRSARADIDHQLSILGVTAESFVDHRAKSLGAAIANGEKRMLQ